MHLAADAELLDEVEVCLTVFAGNVLQVALTLANELQQTATGCMILLVRLEVLSQFFDTLSFDTNLHSSATGVGFVL